jgi:hypothetical protein
MRTLIEINAFLFLANCAMLLFIFKYRVHLHLEYTPRPSKRRHHRVHSERAVIRGTKPSSVPVSPADIATRRDLESALVNLGATKEEARGRADHAMAEGPGEEFEALILRAMQAGTPNRRNPSR